jgi:phospholipid/cholesterol/gamma-HCH transport system ATP-binding protein
VSGEASNNDGHVVLEKVCMSYGSREVLRDLSCVFQRGKISVILGGSGSGKSTILRLIAGLRRPTSGRILIDGEDVTRLNEDGLYEVRKKIGMMFQHGALLDSLSVFDNVAFPLREHSKLGEPEIAEQVHLCLQAVGLNDADALLPRELSGGMIKRVALARALMRNPVVVIADEAFSGLDPVSIKLIEALLVKINREFHVTMILVSHHIPSTMRMADKVVLLIQGRAVQGTPEELAQTEEADVRRFLNEDLDESDEVLSHLEDFESERRPAEPRAH